ncbi:hypothetical protein RFF05_06325 [Bengtsoniella intestinalis]|uniref:hypothetical protein n=1 Tax=Bengtsoniella intestinalis TaxID=3073143 RepID=UPI00391F6383
MAQLLEYACPSCGGAMSFDPTAQNVKCPFCDTVYEMKDLQAYDEDCKDDQTDQTMEWELPPEDNWQDGEADGMRVYVCQSCGGEIVGDETTGATTCPYCDSTVVMKEAFKGDLRPDIVIPFQLDKKAAMEAMAKHFQNKTLLPKVFKDEAHLEDIQGIYVPYWLFDADAKGDMRYKATRVRTWRSGNIRYTETKRYSVRRSGSLAFNAVPADGASKMPDDLMESLEPYDLDKAVDFQTAYLAGYLANRYDVTAEQSTPRINQRIRISVEEAFAQTVTGYHQVSLEQGNVNFHHGKVRYALYPVWLLHTTWNGEKFTFAMNGQSGKFVGNLPMDKGAYYRWFAGLLAGTTAACMIIGLLAGLL